MKQVLIKDGAAVVADVPAPQVSPGNVLVRVAHSCVSAGTEMANVQLSAMPLYRRALRQPQHVRRVLQMVKDQGLSYTMNRVRGMLDAGSSTGYSAAGTVVAVGNEVSGFAVGDRVACAGAGIANHAELIDVPVNLAVHVPDGLHLAHASTVTLGAIALQGVRRVQPDARRDRRRRRAGYPRTAHGAAPARERLLASSAPTSTQRRDRRRRARIGLESGGRLRTRIRATCPELTDGFGADAVIITAASSSSDESCARRSRPAAARAASCSSATSGSTSSARDIYAKEIDFLISTSYGPGRYDPLYEDEGQDYPIGYVRWTENRNMAGVSAHARRPAASRSTALKPRRYPVDEARAAYESLRLRERSRSLVLAARIPDDADAAESPCSSASRQRAAEPDACAWRSSAPAASRRACTCRTC